MPEKQWAKSFGPFALIVRRKTRGSETDSFAMVLVTFLADRWIDITRYDTEHGIPHRDVLGAKGTPPQTSVQVTSAPPAASPPLSSQTQASSLRTRFPRALRAPRESPLSST